MLARKVCSLVAVLSLTGLACVLSSPASALAGAPPVVEEASMVNVAAGSATFTARLDAHELETEYHFEYGPSNAYGEVAPVPSGSVGAEFAGGEVSAHVQGLTAHTVYHYRVVASNNLGTVDGADQTFETQSAGSSVTLPDGREWEMVSPPQKGGALIYGIGQGAEGQDDAVQAAANGDALAYLTSAPTEDQSQGYSLTESLLSTRGPDGWRTQNISTPHTQPTGLSNSAEYRLFSSDLSQGIVQPHGPFEPSISAEGSEQTAYLRTDYPSEGTNDLCTSSCYRPLVTSKPPYANVPLGTEFGRDSTEFPCNPKWSCGPQFAGATPDLKHVAIAAAVPLTTKPTAVEPGSEQLEGGGGYLYEWFDGQLTPISVLPGGTLAVSASLGSSRQRNERHAISDDGSRLFWTAEQGSLEPGLYMRDTTTSETVTIAAGAGIDLRYQTASSDGSRVFFTTEDRLLPSSGGGSSEEPDLYECQIVEVAGSLHCKLSDLTPLTATGENAAVQGTVLGASEDGSYVYFVANGVLAAGAVPGHCTNSQEGPPPPPDATCNLYLYHDGTTKLVAVVSDEDRLAWTNGSASIAPTEQPARVSPNGQWVTFMSERELTGYDNRDALSGERDEEVYLYSALSGRLVCASCDPTGARPVGTDEAGGSVDGQGSWRGRWLAANMPPWTPIYGGAFGHTVYQSRFLSDSGRLFFNSNDALVPQDVNGTWDVYEYEPSGVGACEAASATYSERSGGCVGLISAGASPVESAFLDASESGGDVFFLTASELIGEDTDTAPDVYDAHECSPSSPCPPAAVARPPACSTGDACKAAPTPQPAIFGSPASATFSGAGNIVPASPPTVVSKRTAGNSATRARKLETALTACRRRSKRKRTTCERHAKARYSVRAHKTTTKQGSRG